MLRLFTLRLCGCRFFAENPAVLNPVKISANQQLGYLGMMRVLHRHRFGFKTVLVSKLGGVNPRSSAVTKCLWGVHPIHFSASKSYDFRKW